MESIQGNHIERNITDIIIQSYKRAKGVQVEHTDINKLHRERARNWVGELATSLRNYYKGKEIRVFSKHDYSNRLEFGINEFLYDILVCRVNTIEAPVHKKKLTFVDNALLMVESEFSTDTSEILIDFSKLRIGNAPFKLFIATSNRNNSRVLNTLIRAATGVDSQIFFAFIPHPRAWAISDSDNISVYKFIQDSWKQLY